MSLCWPDTAGNLTETEMSNSTYILSIHLKKGHEVALKRCHKEQRKKVVILIKFLSLSNEKFNKKLYRKHICTLHQCVITSLKPNTSKYSLRLVNICISHMRDNSTENKNACTGQ